MVYSTEFRKSHKAVTHDYKAKRKLQKQRENLNFIVYLILI